MGSLDAAASLAHGLPGHVESVWSCQEIGRAALPFVELASAAGRAEVQRLAVPVDGRCGAPGFEQHSHTGSRTSASRAVKRPSSNHRTRSAISRSVHHGSRSRRSCVFSFASCRRSRIVSAPWCESRFAVGSSARIRSGSLAHARASATRCFSPPESFSTGNSSRAPRPRSVSSRSPARGPPALCARRC